METERAWWENTQTWRTQAGETIPLEELTPAHRRNIIRFITNEATAGTIRASLAVAALEHGAAVDSEEIAQVWRMSNADAVESTPLVKRLRELDAAAE